MQAERNPLNEASPLAAPLEGITRLVLRAPGAVVSSALILAVLAIVVTVNGLSFKTSRLDLLNPRSEYNQRWLAYLHEFGDRDDAVVVVRSDDPRELTRTIDALAAAVAKHPELFESVFYRRDLSALKRKALHFLPEAELTRIAQQVAQASAAMPRGGATADPAAALAQLNEQLAHVRPGSPQAWEAIDRQYAQIAGKLLAGMNAELAGAKENSGTSENRESSGGLRLPLAGQTIPASALAHFDPRYLLADGGRMGFVLLKLKGDEGEFARSGKAITRLRETIDAVRGEHPAAWIGLTGMPVIEFDEMQASQTDMVWTSVLSLIGVAALFAAGYGGLRHALLASLVLLLAMAFSFGYITLAIGHLNILSSAFAVVLIGLGIDFGIHYVSSYLKLRGEGCDELTALVRTASEVGPGIVTGGVTTAAAFFMAGLTDFVGIRELGVVAGGGILLCVLTTAVVLPPLICLVDRQWPTTRVPRILPAAGWFSLGTRWPRLTMVAAVVLTLAAGTGLSRLRYDHNLLNLQPRHLESAQIERQIFTKLEDSVWFAVSVCPSREDLLARKARFAELASVAKTEEIASLLPVATPETQQLIGTIHEQLDDLPTQLPQPTQLNVRRLADELTRARKLLAENTPFETPATAMLKQLLAALAQAPPPAVEQGRAALPAELVAGFQQLAALRELCDPAAPQLADLPRELTDRFVGRTRQHLLKVYAKGDIWDMDRLARFVADVEAIDPRVTGHPVQTYYASRHMQRSYVHAGLYALLAVLALLWIDFRSLAHSLLAMIPLAFGFVQMAGLIGWLDIPLNPANMIVLPLILGIGVDDGVHLVHEWRRQKGRFQLSDSTTVAVLLTSTTTMASFGSMVLARHQGLQSLGQVLTLGVMTCLSSSILFFPAILRWLSRNRQPVAEDMQAPSPVVAAASTALRLAPASLETEDEPEPAPETEPVVAATLPAQLAGPAADDWPEDEAAPHILAFDRYVAPTREPSEEPPVSTIPRRRILPRRVGEAPPEVQIVEESAPTPLDRLAHIRQSTR